MSARVRELLDSIPDEWGRKVEAESGALTETRTGPNSIEFKAPAHMVLVMLTPQPGREVALNSDRTSVFSAPVGTTEIIPADAELFARWRTAKENLLVALEPERLSRLAGLEFQKEDFKFRPPAAGHVDEKALLLANMIREEFQRGEPPNDLYFDSLITVFSTYLLRNYSTLPDRPMSGSRGGLSVRAWREVQDHIRTNLAEKLSVDELAGVAGLSPSHFLRAFRQTAGHAPHQYVLAARLEVAEQLALSTDTPLPMVARMAGFSNHSHMTAAMRRHKSTTPSALRRLRAYPSE
ncbi:helix-turn-helix domain-containing protein [Neorhizobium sp. DT-125]|uniref:helix-turn-helix domain-containing protein n=1 Tax=Neorhizobium sp. DT-125 TaxID=3396163 RepID=UPI003F1D46EC